MAQDDTTTRTYTEQRLFGVASELVEGDSNPEYDRALAEMLAVLMAGPDDEIGVLSQQVLARLHESELEPVETKPMSASDALTAVGDWINEADSFVQTFDHEFHAGEEDDDSDENCRFDNREMDRGMRVLETLLTAADAVLEAENHETHFGLDEAMDDLYIALHGGPAVDLDANIPEQRDATTTVECDEATVLDAIHGLLDGKMWSSDTIEQIATLIDQSGREIRGPEVDA